MLSITGFFGCGVRPSKGMYPQMMTRKAFRLLYEKGAFSILAWGGGGGSLPDAIQFL